MPLYEYRCQTCEQTFEAFVTPATATNVRCPNCNGAELDRLIGLPAKGPSSTSTPATNCRGDGPPCGAAWCGRKT